MDLDFAPSLELCLWMTALAAIAHRERVELDAGLGAAIRELLRWQRPIARA